MERRTIFIAGDITLKFAVASFISLYAPAEIQINDKSALGSLRTLLPLCHNILFSSPNIGNQPEGLPRLQLPLFFLLEQSIRSNSYEWIACICIDIYKSWEGKFARRFHLVKCGSFFFDFHCTPTILIHDSLTYRRNFILPRIDFLLST